MRRITLWMLSTLTTVVLLFSYHTSTSSAGTGSSQILSLGSGAGVARGTGSVGSSGTSGSAGSAGASGTSGAAGSGSSGTANKTYAGDTAQTRWGPVQVQITVQGGKITAASTVQVPNGNREDAQINGYAVPILNDAVVAAQSAQIDMISGATVTSEGYLASLQSAIDKAHL